MPSPISPALADTGGEASPDAIGRSESESCEELVFALKSIESPSFWLESVRPIVRSAATLLILRAVWLPGDPLRRPRASTYRRTSASVGRPDRLLLKVPSGRRSPRPHCSRAARGC